MVALLKKYDVKDGYESSIEVSAELDRLDAALGELMKSFDADMTREKYESIMAECNALIGIMSMVGNLLVNLRRIGK